MATEKDASRTNRILTNVRLTVAEHRAAKRRALELGVPLSELLRRGLLQVLGGADGGQAHEGAPLYRTPGPGEPREPDGCPARGGAGHASPTQSDRQGRLAAFARTAGALRDYDTWMEELDGLRGQPPRDPSWNQGPFGHDPAGSPTGRDGV